MGLAYGQEVANDAYARYIPVWASLGEYFNVNNGYVMRKLHRLALPFFSKKWARQTMAEVTGHGRSPGGAADGASLSGGALAPPAWDENAPDLYIPCMAFITYVLCMGLVKGVIRDFHPDVLVAVATSTLVVQGVEVLLLKAALHALASDAPLPLFDLVAYTGYMYAALVANSLAGLLLGGGAYLAFLAYTGAAGAFFLFRSLSPVLRPEGSVPAAGGADARKKWLLLAVGAMNFALLWWLGPSYTSAAPAAAAAAAAAAPKK